MKRVNPDGTVSLSDDPTPPSPTVPRGTVASIINIPPQIATTIVWIAVGFGLCWWLMCKSKPLDRRGV